MLWLLIGSIAIIIINAGAVRGGILDTTADFALACLIYGAFALKRSSFVLDYRL